MKPDEPINRLPDSSPSACGSTTGSAAEGEPDYRLNRWLVYFASGPDWSSVGEFVATDAPSAIERAVEVFGQASSYRAEMIPWDAAPLLKQGQWPSREERR